MIISLLTGSSIFAAPVDDAWISLSQAFELVARAEQDGGDVTNLITSLNQAAELINTGDPFNLSKANDIINEVKTSVDEVGAAGALATTYKYLVVGFTLALLAIIGLLVNKYGSKIYWLLWLKTRRGWRIKTN